MVSLLLYCGGRKAKTKERKSEGGRESKSSSSVLKCEIFFSVLGSEKAKLCSKSRGEGGEGLRDEDDVPRRGEDDEFLPLHP